MYVYGIVSGIHSLASFFWVGSLLFLSFVLIPKAKTLSPKEGKVFLNGVFDRLTPVVLVSIVLIVVSGILMKKMINVTGKASPVFNVVHLIKIILTILMVVIAALRQIMRIKMKKNMAKMQGQGESGTQGNVHAQGQAQVQAQAKNAGNYTLVYINAFLGAVIVILSGLMSAV